MLLTNGKKQQFCTDLYFKIGLSRFLPPKMDGPPPSLLVRMMKKQIAQRLRVLTRPQTGLYRLMMCRCLHMPLPGVRFRFRKDQSWLQIVGRMQPVGCNRCLSKLPFCRDGSVTVSDEALMDRQHKQKTGRSKMRTKVINISDIRLTWDNHV